MNTIDPERDWKPRIVHDARHLYLSIVAALRADIAAGRVNDGDRLPTHRELADLLGVGLSTVTRAYSEAARCGLITSTVGRGTFVTDASDRRGRLGEPHPGELIEMSVDLPLYALDPDLGPILRLLASDDERGEWMRNQSHRGMAAQRTAGVAWFAHLGLTAQPDNVTVCAGAQHALLIALMATCQPGDRVLCEALTYPGLRTAVAHLGLDLHPVAIDEGGIDADRLERAARHQRAKVLFVMPSLANPTTRAFDDSRRDAVADIADRHGLYVIEDETHRLVAHAPGASICSRLPERGLTIATLSKSVASGLRIGYLDAPSSLVPALSDAAWASIWMVPPLMGEIARRWIEDGTAARVASDKGAAAGARQRVCHEILGDVPYESQPRAHSIWLHLRAPWTSATFVEAARARGVAVSPALAFHVGNTKPPRAVRVCLSAPDSIEAMERGLIELRGLLSK